MNREAASGRSRLTSPRAAAVAGILFSVLLITAQVLLRASIPDNPREPTSWQSADLSNLTLALNLVPFAGIAFLWFIGVVRDRLGESEDKLFATVFLGSGLLFLAMLFGSAALAGGILVSYGAAPAVTVDPNAYSFARTVTFVAMNTYAMRMAGVFMISTSTLILRTGVMPRWTALLGYVLALILLLTITAFNWVSSIFPVWVFLISVYILIEGLRSRGAPVVPLAQEPTGRT
jgi:hypothetical protein